MPHIPVAKTAEPFSRLAKVNTGSPPTTYGDGDRPPRGDYTRAAPDFTCSQDYGAYSEADHDIYRRLFVRQTAKLSGYACDEFITAVDELGAPSRIPRFEEINDRLRPRTGWTVVAVPGLIPEEAFFALLAARRFPVTDWIRKPEEFDYVVEPDIFHDLFGHVPLLFNPVFADYMEAYGKGGLKATRLEACEMLARLYWYTVEFGLIRTDRGLRAYGAGILSSAGELAYSLDNKTPLRLRFSVERLMRSRYKIDSFQATYFVIDSFQQLFESTAPDFEPTYRRIERLPLIDAGIALPEELNHLPG